MGAYQNLKKRVYKVIGPAQKGDKLSALFDYLLCVLVLLSCTAVIVELFPIDNALRSGLETFEYVTVGLFILEYLLRLWTCEYLYPECENKLAAVKEYITSFDSLIDLLSIFSILFN